MEKNEVSKWYLIQCKIGQEDRAVTHLANQSFECYKPEIAIEKIKKGRLVTKGEALFPGYIFIRMDKVNSNWSVIRSTRGVIKLVSFGSLPIPVDEEIIKELRLSDIAKTESLFRKGDFVNVIDGPFVQLDAVFHEKDGEKRAVVLLNLMNQWHRVSLPFAQLSA